METRGNDVAADSAADSQSAARARQQQQQQQQNTQLPQPQAKAGETEATATEDAPVTEAAIAANNKTKDKLKKQGEKQDKI
jgi:hypothetical protein